MDALQKKLDYANKRVSFAWAKVYEGARARQEADWRHYRTLNRTGDDNVLPQHIKDELTAMAKELKKEWECPICLEFIPIDTLEITNCGHYYCRPCLDGWRQASRQQGLDKWSCGKCNRRHNFN
jgi:hypothetical protein